VTHSEDVFPQSLQAILKTELQTETRLSVPHHSQFIGHNSPVRAAQASRSDEESVVKLGSNSKQLRS
jgi:hypothetical protein